MWARSTWLSRVRLLERFRTFCHRRRWPLNNDAAAMFVVSTGVRPSAQLAYVKSLRAMLKPRTRLDLLAAGLVGSGANIPTRQAQAMPLATLRAYLRSVDNPRTAAALRLAWKTASRWSDVSRLTRADFLRVESRRLVIDFGTKTKTTRNDPYRASRFVVVTGRWTRQIAQAVRALPPKTPLSPLSTSALTRELHRHPATRLYSAHSLKRGALQRLLPAVARGKIRFREVVRLAKHRDRRNDPQASTLRYLGRSTQLAQAIGANRAVKML